RRPPLIAVDEVVPVRDQIVDRAALVAERDTAIHAARRLLAVLGIGQRLDELLPAAAAGFRLVVTPVLALDLEKAGRPTHGSGSAARCPSPSRRRGPLPLPARTGRGALRATTPLFCLV